MADFAQVLQVADAGYWDRKDFPPYALTPWEDRNRWTTYLRTINNELDAEKKENKTNEVV